MYSRLACQLSLPLTCVSALTLCMCVYILRNSRTLFHSKWGTKCTLIEICQIRRSYYFFKAFRHVFKFWKSDDKQWFYTNFVCRYMCICAGSSLPSLCTSLFRARAQEHLRAICLATGPSNKGRATTQGKGRATTQGKGELKAHCLHR